MRAFTLLDVLVTCAIVALLLVLITPGIANSLAAARSVKCVSNLREIHRSMMNYVETYQTAPVWNEYPEDVERWAVEPTQAVWVCPADPDKGVNRRGGRTSYDASGFRAMRFHSMKNGDRFTHMQADMRALAVAWDYTPCHTKKRNRIYADGTVRRVP